MSSGLNNYIGIGKETTYGNPVAPTVFLPIKESDGIQIDKDIQFIEAIKSGVAGKNKGAFVGKVEYAGGYESDAYPQFLGHILRSVFGAVSSALESGESTVYRHTFTEALTKFSYTVEQKIGEIIKRFAGFIVKNIKIEGKAGEAVSVAFEGIGKSQADASESTPSYETSRPFNFADISSIKIGSTEVKAYCEEFSVEYDNKLEGFYSMGSNELQSVYSKPSEVKGKLTLYLDDTTKAFLEDYIAKTQRTIEIKAEGDAIGTASKETLYLKVPKATMTAVTTKLGMEYNAMEIEFEGVVDATDGLFTMYLINTLSSY
jgi:hypothetical protein